MLCHAPQLITLLQQFFFLRRSDVFQILDPSIGFVLNLLFQIMEFIIVEIAVLVPLLEVIHGFTTNVADSNLGLF